MRNVEYTHEEYLVLLPCSLVMGSRVQMLFFDMEG